MLQKLEGILEDRQRTLFSHNILMNNINFPDFSLYLELFRHDLLLNGDNLLRDASLAYLKKAFSSLLPVSHRTIFK